MFGKTVKWDDTWRLSQQRESASVSARVGVMQVEIEAGPDGVLGTDDDVVTISPAPGPHRAPLVIEDETSGPLATDEPTEEPDPVPTAPPVRRRETTQDPPAKKKRGRPRKRG